MTAELQAAEIVTKLEAALPGSTVESNGNTIVIKDEFILKAATFLKNTTGFEFDYLNFMTATDYITYFELVYDLVSLKHNHKLVLKIRLTNREKPGAASVVSIWKGADFQEREIYDLFGISFTGHPNLKRIFLWEGFQGYPLRKDFKQ
jgi:NADH (or F420H2) dehydrogenase, subunit C